MLSGALLIHKRTCMFSWRKKKKISKPFSVTKYALSGDMVNCGLDPAVSECPWDVIQILCHPWVSEMDTSILNLDASIIVAKWGLVKYPWQNTSRKHAYIILTPLKPHFYIVKLGFTIYIIFLTLLKNINCDYSLEPPCRGGSNEYTQSMFWAEIWKNIRVLYLKIFNFWRWFFLYILISVFLVMSKQCRSWWDG